MIFEVVLMMVDGVSGGVVLVMKMLVMSGDGEAGDVLIRTVGECRL